jgi:aminoglycoside phosphotransferase
MADTALEDARRRIAARPSRDRIARHLEVTHGIAVAGLSELDLGVYRVERAGGPAWVARVFPAARPQNAAAGDAEILRFLAAADFQSERGATTQPLSVFDRQAVLVTEFVPGVPRAERGAAIRANGGLRRLGEMLGQLHSLPAADGPAARPGGAWHHLAVLPAQPSRRADAPPSLGANCAPQSRRRRAVGDAVGPLAVNFLRSEPS